MFTKNTSSPKINRKNKFYQSGFFFSTKRIQKVIFSSQKKNQ